MITQPLKFLYAKIYIENDYQILFIKKIILTILKNSLKIFNTQKGVL